LVRVETIVCEGEGMEWLTGSRALQVRQLANMPDGDAALKAKRYRPQQLHSARSIRDDVRLVDNVIHLLHPHHAMRWLGWHLVQ
jgi:hypothetical protein